MQQGFAQLQQKSLATGARAGAHGSACAVTRLGEVRPYSPFGLMHLEGTPPVQRIGGRRGGIEIEQEQRGRPGLAA